MSDVAVRVENLSKLYRVGEYVGYQTLRESLMRAFSSPFRKTRSLDLDSEYIWALKDVSFEIKRGEVVGIIGRNGAGKSTLLKILTRITTPTEGYAEIRGPVGSLLEVGTGFHPELTGRENIYLNGAVLGMKKSEIDRKFKEIVEFSGVEKFIDTPLKRYSSGMQVRLAFAIAAHLEPEILLVDEVLAVGDIEFQKRSLGKMGEIAREGRTVLFVSHNLASIRDLCPRALLLDEGNLIMDAPASETIVRYVKDSASLKGETTLESPALRRVAHGWSSESQFRWVHVALINSRGEVSSNIELGEPFEVVLHGVAETDLTDVKAGFAISLPGGTQIIHSMHTDSGLSSLIPAGKVEFRCRLEPNVLAPGTYELGVGARGINVTEWIPVALMFNVLLTGPASSSWDRDHNAIICQPCHWQYRRDES